MSINPTELEAVLHQLTQPESSIISAAETRLEELSGQSGFWLIPELTNQLDSTQQSTRHMAAVLLRKKLTQQWIRLAADMKNDIKIRLMDRLFSEPVTSVGHAIASIVAVVAKFELKMNTWPELLGGLYMQCGSADVKSREIGMYLLGELAETATDQLLSELATMFELFCRALQDTSLIMAASACKCLVTLMPEFQRKHVTAFRTLIPYVLSAVQRCIADENPLVSDIVEVLNEAAESELALVSKNLGDIVPCMVGIASNPEIDEGLRAVCFDHLIFLFTDKSKALVKQGLVTPIMESAAKTLSEGIVVEEDDDMIDLQKAVVALIDGAATNIPPEIILPIVAPIIISATAHEQASCRHAGFVILQCLVDGCSNFIRTTETLPQMLSMVVKGTNDPDTRVRRRALVAMNKFIYACQPEISEFHTELLPVIIGALDSDILTMVSSACDALENLIDGMGEKILLYLNDMMIKLGQLLEANEKNIQRAALSCIAMVAKSAGDNFQPFFHRVISFILTSLKNAHIAPRTAAEEDPDTDAVNHLCQLIDSLSCVGTCMSDRTEMSKLIPDCMTFAIQQMQLDEPDVRGAIFGLFGAMASVSPDDFEQFLPVVIQALTETIAGDPELELVPSVDDEYGVENDYVLEKQAAYDALATLADMLEHRFIPYINTTLELVCRARTVVPLSTKELGSNTIRKANAAAIISLVCVTFKSIHSGAPQELLPPLADALNAAFDVIIHCLSEPIEMQEDVAIAGLDLLQQHLAAVGSSAFVQPEHLTIISERLFAILQSEDDTEDDEDDDEFTDELESEVTLMKQTAIDTIPHLARAIGPHFQSTFDTFFSALKIFGAPHRHTALRTSVVGCFAEVVEVHEGQLVNSKAPELFEFLLETIKDEDAVVSSNSAFALGLLCQSLGAESKSYVQAVFSALYTHCLVRQFETAAVADNACAAVGRILLAVPDIGIPLEQIFPTLIGGLPLKEDFTENKIVIKCVTHLFRTNMPAIHQYLPRFLEVASVTAQQHGQFDDDTRTVLRNFVGWLNREHPDALTGTIGLQSF